MKLTMRILAFFLMLCLIEANGRNIENEYDDLPESNGQQDVTNHMREHHLTQNRHRRRPRQMFAYDYAPPYFYAEKRDYRQQEDYLAQITKNLEEIISYIRRPPPPPQPIYIPYPVYQSRPCNCPGTTYKLCKTPSGNASKNKTDTAGTSIPALDDRGLFEVMREDPNKNWGLIPEEVDDSYDDGNDGSRPINLEPVETLRPLRRPAPPVEHGSSQAGRDTTPAVSRPGVCETAILNCCILSDKVAKRNCFARYNCSKTYATNRACDKEVIDKVIDHFTKAYGPTGNM